MKTSGMRLLAQRAKETDEKEKIRQCIHPIECMLCYAGHEHISITYGKETEESIKALKPWDVQRFGILSGEELFMVWDDRTGDLLYVVNVTADSMLTAVSELMNLLARKF